jgi:hypothetical protein
MPGVRVSTCKTMSTSANDIQRMNGLQEDAVQEIEQIHSRWIEFEIAGEIYSLMALCADDIELWPPDSQPLFGRPAVSAYIARGSRGFTALRLPNVGFEVQTRLLT